MEGVIMKGNPDDMLLLKNLNKSPVVWQELQQIREQLTNDDRNVKWSDSKQMPNGDIQIPYPLYSDRLRRVIKLLSIVGAVTPQYHWMDHGLPDFSLGESLSPGDAIRAATTVIRGERFHEGAIAKAISIGLLDAILDSLINWYLQERE